MTVTTGGPARRAILAAGVLGGLGLIGTAGALVYEDVLPGRVAALKWLGLTGPAGAVPAVPTGPSASGRFRSHRRGVDVNWAVSYPRGFEDDARLPVCLVLHGRGASAAGMQEIGYPQVLSAAVAAGVPPFALAAVDGGETYWHPRRDGDAQGMLLEEFLPLLARRGLQASENDRIGVLGWSMGGYGALLLAARLGSERVAGVVAESPALWLEPGDSAAGAFDDREDFERNDVFTRARLRALTGVRVKIDCGRADPFWWAARTYAQDLGKATGTAPETDFGDGVHTNRYWLAKAPKSIGFIGNALVR
ncbi:alpha/beta hydrolase [Spongisporangium articulatum]|uniref:Alpha/beta hydrolase n=1 Tax=Spongisporangium articulatum TaxID=3362603 RepID=A0ABW8AS79_9ACTN